MKKISVLIAVVLTMSIVLTGCEFTVSKSDGSEKPISFTVEEKEDAK